MATVIGGPAPHGRDWGRARAALCWAVGLMGVVGGAGQLLLPGNWPSERVGGLVVMLGSPALLPPMMERVRQHFAIARSRVAPIVYAVALTPIGMLISSPFVPSAAEQGRLQVIAMQQAAASLRRGQPRQARAALRNFVGRRGDDPQLAALLNRIDAQQRAAAPKPAAISAQPAVSDKLEPKHDAAADYAERAQTYWLSQVSAMPDAPPSQEAIGQMLSELDGLIINLRNGDSLQLTADQRGVQVRLKQAVSRKQVKLLPNLRRAYAAALDAKLFRRDIRVQAQGSTLQLTGPIFVRNANVEDIEAELQPVVDRLRFRHVEYRWSAHDASLRYDLAPPPDSELGSWNGRVFVPVGRVIGR